MLQHCQVIRRTYTPGDFCLQEIVNFHENEEAAMSIEDINERTRDGKVPDTRQTNEMSAAGGCTGMLPRLTSLGKADSKRSLDLTSRTTAHECDKGDSAQSLDLSNIVIDETPPPAVTLRPAPRASHLPTHLLSMQQQTRQSPRQTTSIEATLLDSLDQEKRAVGRNGTRPVTIQSPLARDRGGRGCMFEFRRAQSVRDISRLEVGAKIGEWKRGDSTRSLDLSSIVIDETPPPATTLRPDPIFPRSLRAVESRPSLGGENIKRERTLQANAETNAGDFAHGSSTSCGSESTSIRTSSRKPRQRAYEWGKVDSSRSLDLSHVSLRPDPIIPRSLRTVESRPSFGGENSKRERTLQGNGETKAGDFVHGSSTSCGSESTSIRNSSRKPRQRAYEWEKVDSSRSLDLSHVSIDETPPPPTALRPTPKMNPWSRKEIECTDEHQRPSLSEFLEKMRGISDDPVDNATSSLLDQSRRMSTTSHTSHSESQRVVLQNQPPTAKHPVRLTSVETSQDRLQANAPKRAVQEADEEEMMQIQVALAESDLLAHQQRQPEEEDNILQQALRNSLVDNRSYATVASSSNTRRPQVMDCLNGLDAELEAAAWNLSPEELDSINQALKADNVEESHGTSSTDGALSTEEKEHEQVGKADTVERVCSTAVQLQYTGITEEEAAAIELAISEADAAEEAKSLQLALRMQEEEERWQQQRVEQVVPNRTSIQGNVRTMTRAEIRAEEAANAGAYMRLAPPQRQSLAPEPRKGKPLDEHSGDMELPAGFRMNSTTEHLWSRLDQNSIVGPNNEVRTKHDGALDSQANIHRLGLDDDGITSIGNRTFNSFRQSMKRKTKKGVAAEGTGRAGSDSDGTKGGALDAASFEQIARVINSGLINRLNGIVKEGKEAVIYHADKGLESGGYDVAVKMFKRIQEFRNRGEYVDGDPRFHGTSFKDASKRQQLELWTEKEFRNLTRASRAGVPVPTPLMCKGNILFMRFMGETGWPAPQLREANLRKGSKKWTTLHRQILRAVRSLYTGASLVHGDLSEYNIMVVPANFVENVDRKIENEHAELQAVLVDFGQAVDVRHPQAHDLLKRDLERVTSFFSRQGVEAMTAAEALRFVVEPSNISEHEHVNSSKMEISSKHFETI